MKENFKKICQKIDYDLNVKPSCGPMEMPKVENAFKSMNTNCISGKVMGIIVVISFIVGQILIISTR